MINQPHDPGPASGTRARGSTAPVDPDTFDGAYRLLVMSGLSSVEAGNIVAYLAGLRPVERGWALHEIKALVGLRSLLAGGFIDS